MSSMVEPVLSNGLYSRKALWGVAHGGELLRNYWIDAATNLRCTLWVPDTRGSYLSFVRTQPVPAERCRVVALELQLRPIAGRRRLTDLKVELRNATGAVFSDLYSKATIGASASIYPFLILDAGREPFDEIKIISLGGYGEVFVRNVEVRYGLSKR